jgi:hypothetical protein
MRLEQLFPIVERLRFEAIGTPVLDRRTGGYVYQERSAKVVAVLKLIRASQGVASMHILCQAGLFIDFGVIIRCVDDCIGEVYFLLDDYPRTSSNVGKFVRGFFESEMTADGHTSQTTPAVESAKTRSARVRYLKGGEDEATRRLLGRSYKTFSGYVHANCAQIMEIFGGPARNFNLAGVPSAEEQRRRMEFVELFTVAVLRAVSFVAQTLELRGLHQDITRILSAA